MTQESPSQTPSTATGEEAQQAGKATRIGATAVLALIAASLLWYFAADRLTPHTTQARVQAFVVPVAAEVAGKVLAVHVRNNDAVQPGQPLFDIDPTQYRIALQRSRSDYESVQRSVNAASATVEAARAGLEAARANHVKAEKDATRQETLYAEDPGAISVRRLEVAQATRIQARSQEKAAEADLRKAQEAAGESGDNNAAAMTLIANHDLWINADLTENNLGNIDPGDEVAIVLDVLPGEVLKGRVRSVGGGVSSGQQAPAGTLPTVQNSRDWLRQAQRFPVAIEFDPADAERLGKLRPGGQAEVMVYTGDNFVMNLLGAGYIRLMSLLSYLY